MSEEMQKQSAEPEIDQAEIDREIAELLGGSTSSDEESDSQEEATPGDAYYGHPDWYGG